MSRILALQMDPLERLDPLNDNTAILAAEAQRRGYVLWHYTPDTLSLKDGELSAEIAPLKVFLKTEPYWELGPRQRRGLAEADVLLMRQNPPFDMAYITATYFLETLPPSTRVVNNPFHVRNHPEKLFPLLFRQYAPPTLMTSDAREIDAFRREHRDVVIKPLYGYGGHGVLLLRDGDANAPALMEMLLQRTGGEPLVVQPFLPEVAHGERRIFLLNGEIRNAYGRIPAPGDIRSNVRAGGTPQPTTVTPRQQEICAALGPVLREKGLLLAGVDFIGDWLIEINITSPTGIGGAKRFYGTEPEKEFWDLMEA